MNALARLFRPRIELPPALAARIDAWRGLAPSSESCIIDVARFVVIDVETSGLDPRRDRLLSIGAIAIENMRMAPGAGFAATLRHARPNARTNTLIYGIGPQTQVAGEEPEQALTAFLEFIGTSPCVRFTPISTRPC